MNIEIANKVIDEDNCNDNTGVAKAITRITPSSAKKKTPTIRKESQRLKNIAKKKRAASAQVAGKEP